MSSNQTLLQKADLALSDLATAGLLNTEQTDRFMRKLMITPTILNACRFVTMKSHTRKINKIGFGSRIMRPATSGTPLAANQRVKPDLTKVEITTKEVIAELNIPYDVFEDNIEGGNVAVDPQGSPGGLHSTIVDMIAERAAVDFEEQGLLGDTASGDAYLAMHDGWLKLANANVVDAAGAALSKDILKLGVRAMPDQYLRDRASLRQIVSVDQETELRDQYSERQTALGDQTLQGTAPLFLHGSPILGASRMPSTKGLFTDPRNLIFGIWRNLMIEYDKDIRARNFIIVLTARTGYQIEEADAAVTYNNLTLAA